MSRSINEVKAEVKEVFSSDGIGEAIKQLKVLLHPEGSAYNSLLQIEQKLKEVNLQRVKGSIDQRELDIKYADLADRLLTLLDDLDITDLEGPKPGKKSKQGSLLYQIPSEMEVQKETRCRVRIAYETTTLLENIELTKDTHLRDVRISEVMQAELIDPSQDAAFVIRTFNRAEQFIEKDDYTEWTFFVKPLRQGSFPLLLRISVIEKIGEKERVRDIVLEETVVIVAELDNVFEPVFKESGYVVKENEKDKDSPGFTKDGVRPISPVLRKMVSAVVALAALITVSGIAYATLPPVRMNVDWTLATLRNTQDGYREFAEKYEGQPKAGQALIKLEELDWEEVVEDKSTANVERFVEEHPNGRFEKRATELLETLYYEKLVSNAPPESLVPSIESFIKRFPKGNLTEKAKKRLRRIKQEKKNTRTEQSPTILAPDGLSPVPSQRTIAARSAAAWAGALAADTPEAVSEYLRLFPDGPEAGQARKWLADRASALERADWEAALRANTIEAYTAHKRRYPSGVYTAEADKRLSELQEVADFNAAVAQNTVAAYRGYLEKYPDGARAGEARSRLNALQAAAEEAQAWQSARTENTPAAYRRYLEAWPQGKHAAEATQLLEGASGSGDVIKQLEANMVRIKGGTFTMGCTSEQGSDCDSDERPAHQVTVSDFYIGRYEVTQKEWREVMGSDPPELAFKGCDNCPVERVSWEDIQQFLLKLNAKTGKAYRLPTEAEWEYAARGGSSSRGFKYAGSNTIDEVAWYTSNSGDKTRPVGQKKSNELGLYDMSGNVWEWCQDWKGDYSSSAQTNPKGPSTGFRRVMRGGSWSVSPQGCRVARRGYITPGYRDFYSGFRLSRTL
jgi:formylglycine-generating enzyme required for sulfatase activity